MDNRRNRRDRFGLCFRCEHRAQYFETGIAPRMECGEPDYVKYACYMYKPVKPVVVKALDNDDSYLIFGPAMVADRVRFERIATNKDCVARLTELNDGEFIATWERLDKDK